MKALEGMKASVDTSIPFNFANQREQLTNSYQNPMGAYTSPAVRDALQRSGGQGLAQQEAQAQQNSQNYANDTNYGRAASYAAMTAPKFVQTGGTSTQTQSGGLLGELLGGALGIGGAAASGGFSAGGAFA